MMRNLSSRQGSSPAKECEKDPESFRDMDVADHCVDGETRAGGRKWLPLVGDSLRGVLEHGKLNFELRISKGRLQCT